MSFDWLQFLSSRGIPYVTSGPNVPRGDVAAVACPWCGRADPSQHLAISNSGFHCWRNKEHKGRNPARLVQALLHCSIEQANEITGRNTTHVPDDFLSVVKRQLNPTPPYKPTHELKLPKEFRSFRHLPSARPFLKYLRNRGYTENHIMHRFPQYGIRYCIDGPFHHRIIFPVVFEGKLVSWTGRSISPNTQVRYKSLTPDPELARQQGLQPALGSISRYLLWYDIMMKSTCTTIMLCEGPFDSLKVNILGNFHGVCSTCFFTSGPSHDQISLLHQLLPRFRRKILLLDRGTLATSLKVHGQLQTLGVEILQLSDDRKDPGELRTHHELLKILGGHQ